MLTALVPCVLLLAAVLTLPVHAVSLSTLRAAALELPVTRLVVAAPAQLLSPAPLPPLRSDAAVFLDAAPYFCATAQLTALSVRAANGTHMLLRGCVPCGLEAAVAAAVSVAGGPNVAAPCSGAACTHGNGTRGGGGAILVLVPTLPCGFAAVPAMNMLSSWLPEVVRGGARGVVLEAFAATPAPAEAPVALALTSVGAVAMGAPLALALLDGTAYGMLVEAAAAAAAAAAAPLAGELVLVGDTDESSAVVAAPEYGAYACLGGETLVLACVATLPLAACALAELALGVLAVWRATTRPPRTTLVPLMGAYGGVVIFTLANAAQQLALALGADAYTLTHAHAVLAELGWLALFAAYASITTVFARSLALMHDAYAGGAGTWERAVLPLYAAWLAFLAVAAVIVVVVATTLPADALVVSTALHVVALVPTAVAAAGVGFVFVVRARRASMAPSLRAALRRLVALLVVATLCFVALAALYIAQSVVRATVEALRYGTLVPCALRTTIRVAALVGGAALLVFLRAWRLSVVGGGGGGGASATTAADGATLGTPSTAERQATSVRPRRARRSGRGAAAAAAAAAAEASPSAAFVDAAATHDDVVSGDSMAALPD